MKREVDAFVIAVILACLSCLYALNSSAQAKGTTHSWDTIPARVANIQKYVMKQTKKSVIILAVYVDTVNQIEEILPISESVYEYLLFCKENAIEPQIGIKLRDRELYSIVRIRKRL